MIRQGAVQTTLIHFQRAMAQPNKGRAQFPNDHVTHPSPITKARAKRVKCLTKDQAHILNKTQGT